MHCRTPCAELFPLSSCDIRIRGGCGALPQTLLYVLNGGIELHSAETPASYSASPVVHADGQGGQGAERGAGEGRCFCN